MVTQELISYVRGEVNKGKTREEIRTALLSGGGWSEADISEVFRSVMPLSGGVEEKPVIPTIINPSLAPSLATPSPVLSKKSFSMSHKTKELIIVLVVALLVGGAGYFYRAQLGEAWSGVQSRLANLSFNFSDEEEVPVVNTPIAKDNKVEDQRLMAPKNCGVTIAPDMKSAESIQKDYVLDCIGQSATSCEPAKAILDSAFLPTMLEISRGDTVDDMECKFRLSYKEDSTLTSVDGEKLAGESLSCPLSIVRSLTAGEKNTLVFGEPTKSNPPMYGAEIYFYGTAGLFIENEFSEQKIKDSGCAGGFIHLFIDSYNRIKPE
jgi:hypothetical protein